DTLWDLAIAEVEKREKADNDGKRAEVWERSILFMGNKNGGKTTIILRCLKREEIPKPTLALEYTFGRRARRPDTPKDVAHFWELGGGTSLMELIRIPITSNSIRTFAVVLVLDLSTPNELWTTMEKLLQVTRNHVNKILAKLEKTNPEVATEIKQRMWNSLQRDHPLKVLTVIFWDLFLSCKKKYQLFQEFDSEVRKIIKKKIRFVSHYYGASLVVKKKNEQTCWNGLQVLARDGKKNIPCEQTNQIITSISKKKKKIGPPPASDSDIAKLRANTPLELWKKVFEKTFPPKSSCDLQDTRDPAQDLQYAEHEVDVMRAQKKQELEQYKRNASKSWKEMDFGSD
ncbi:DC2L1 protein, partial [Probosciger aterrimus]|nr:DC2L1 protein [Probosciger aterrimus]